MHWLYGVIRNCLVHWGYWAVLLGLMAESAGIPVPGETVLMFSSFLAHKHTGLNIGWVIAVGVTAATLGDNLGFWFGRLLGARLSRWMKKLFHLDDEDMAAAKDQVTRHGATTIFFARFIFGLRTIAGPLAGMLGMDWHKFLLYNFLGAAAWVTGMASIGYAFANEFDTLLGYIEKLSWLLAGVLFAVGYWLWHRQKKRFENRVHAREEA